MGGRGTTFLGVAVSLTRVEEIGREANRDGGRPRRIRVVVESAKKPQFDGPDLTATLYLRDLPFALHAETVRISGGCP